MSNAILVTGYQVCNTRGLVECKKKLCLVRKRPWDTLSAYQDQAAPSAAVCAYL